MKARNETAIKFQRFIAGEVIPSIRRTGSFSKKLTRAEQILEQAKALVKREKEGIPDWSTNQSQDKF